MRGPSLGEGGSQEDYRSPGTKTWLAGIRAGASLGKGGPIGEAVADPAHRVSSSPGMRRKGVPPRKVVSRKQSPLVNSSVVGETKTCAGSRIRTGKQYQTKRQYGNGKLSVRFAINHL